MTGQIRATISTTSKYLPEKVMTNHDLEKLVDTNDEWIVSRTGISERRVVESGQATADMCIHVAREILQKRDISADDIDVIIIGTVTPDMLLPSTAALVQDAIGASSAWGYDLSAACSGFLFALETGVNLIESGRYNKVLVLGADTMTSILDYEDRGTCVLFGDGAGGVLLEPSQDENYIIDSLLYTDGSGGKYLCLPGGGSMHPATEKTVRERMHFIKQDGKKVFKFAVIGMADISSDILKKHGLTGNDIKLFIPHQANKRIIDACVNRLGLSPDQVLINIDKYANTTGATIAIGLAEAVEEGRVQTGDYILLAAFGAGFTWGSTLIRWGTTY